MNLKMNPSEETSIGISAFDNPQKEISRVLAGMFDIMLPTALFFGGIALAVSIYRSVHYGWPFILFLHTGMYLTAMAVLVFRRRLPATLIFSLMLVLISIDVIHSLITFGLAGSGMTTLAILIAFAGIFLGIRTGIIFLIVGVAAASLIGIGICTGFITPKPDLNHHLFAPANWIVQICCSVLYVVPLVFSVNVLQKNMVASLQESKTNNDLLETEIAMRRQAEEKLKKSEARYKGLADSLPQAVVEFDEKGNFTFVNLNGIEMFGYTKDDFDKGFNVIQAIVPEDRDRGMANIRKLATGETTVSSNEYTALRKDGSTFPIAVFATPVIAETESARLRAIVIDITERKRAEQALQESEEKYRNIFEKAVEGVFQTTPEGQLLSFNPSLARMLGYDSKGGMDPCVKDVGGQIYVHPEDRLRFRAVLEQQGYVEGFETQLRRKDGKAIWASLHARAVYDDQGKMARIEGTVENITKRKNAEQALFESEEKYRRVVETSLVSLYIIQDNIFRFVNQKFCDLSGYTYDELVDTLKPLRMIHPDDRKRVKEIAEKLLSGKTDYIEYEHKAIRKDGNVVTIKVFGSSITYNGRIAISGTCIDVTREKSLESQLRQAQKVEAIGTLAGGIAHDFNNILTVITGYGTLLQMKVDTADPLRVYVDNILSASQKATSLTQNLLTFGRKQPVTLKPVDINKLIQGTENLLKRLLFEDITLETHLSSDKIIIMADATHIDQILFNLVTNARDAMPKGGKLGIETRLLKLDAEFVKAHGFGKPGRYALLSISDTGVGMDETTRGKIFDPFFTTKEMGKGTGLGLSTVYGVVKQHNGYITVHSEPDTGTAFQIYFPEIKAMIDEEMVSTWDIREGDETILVAEDNANVRQLMRDILVRYGYTVIEAVDGEEAIDKFKKHETIDMVILDTVMPKKNGKEAYDQIKKDRPDIKVIFTSGYTKDIVLDKGIREKEFDFISKPLAPNELLKRVRDILDRG